MRQKKSSLVFVSIIFLVLCLLYSLPLRLNNEIADIEAGILYKIRGSRSISENIFVVYIGDEDVSGLHGWPFTRDYFSYAIHALKNSGARTIAVDILFSGLSVHRHYLPYPSRKLMIWVRGPTYHGHLP